MKDSGTYRQNQEESVHLLENLDKDLEKMLEDVEKISVQVTCIAYDMVVLRTDPEVAESLGKLKDSFLKCTAVLESNWQDAILESKENDVADTM
ncbi:synaptonemal complex central element protein 3 [Acipenser oxyrinchus oxyrinchus]|uniref:Synaptonemal complex central element protein 3 n=1 Tax=Acipenser oxyrinchus oxyrinchus TaxID=40147 RepID=A0AAD8CWI1_ACIOX|nr:synaptonemal complex central element protein 3 [Acipenser oxyrinchus oxyrinchus]